MMPAEAISGGASQRNRELDGIRGWAALTVIVQHLALNVFSAYVPALAAIPYFFRDGAFAVLIFFTLSGDALSAKFLQTSDLDDVRNLALRRYPRLAGVIVFSCVAMYLLMVLGLAPHAEAAPLVGNANWFLDALSFPPNFVQMFGYALWGVYTQFQWHPADSYNPFLWTMSVELLGSALIFGYMLIYGRLRYKVRTTIVVMLLSALINVYVPLFFLGMLIGIARHKGVFERWLSSTSWQIGSMGLFLAFAVYDSIRGEQTGEGIKGLIAALLVACVCSNRLLRRAFTSRLSRFLGHISFPLYAMQFPVMMSFTAGAIILTNSWGLLSPTSAIVIIALSFAAIIVVAAIVARLEDTYLRAVARGADRLLLARDRTAAPGATDVSV